MALLKDANPKNVSGAYQRIFGNDDLGRLMSKVQSTVISSGLDLEKMIIQRVAKIAEIEPGLDLDTFLQQNIALPQGVFLVPKKQVKDSKVLQFSGSEPDFLIFRNRGGRQTCHVIELKDGHVFDTKKVEGEAKSMQEFIQQNSPNIPYTVKGHFCAFNQDDKSAIVEGFKRKIPSEQVLTGREFCELLEIDYDEIIEERKANGSDNLEYFLGELVGIAEVRQHLLKLLD